MAPRAEAIGYPGPLRKERQRLGLTQGDAELRTEALGGLRVSGQAIGNLETGHRQPSRRVLEAVAAAYGCDVEAIGHVLADDEVACSHCKGRGYRKVAPAKLTVAS